jgi:hypothetical protein
MRMQIESTDKIVTFNGIPMRCWEGATEAGVPVVAFIARVAVPEGRKADDYVTFQRELKETRKPTPELAGAFDARMVL